MDEINKKLSIVLLRLYLSGAIFNFIAHIFHLKIIFFPGIFRAVCRYGNRFCIVADRTAPHRKDQDFLTSSSSWYSKLINVISYFPKRTAPAYQRESHPFRRRHTDPYGLHPGRSAALYCPYKGYPLPLRHKHRG